MKYLDSSLNASVEEAVQVFCTASYNKRALRMAGVYITDADSVTEKLAKIRSVCLSEHFGGSCQVAPKDASIRNLLVSQDFLPSADADQYEVLEAMEEFVEREGLTPMTTYT